MHGYQGHPWLDFYKVFDVDKWCVKHQTYLFTSLLAGCALKEILKEVKVKSSHSLDHPPHSSCLFHCIISLIMQHWFPCCSLETAQAFFCLRTFASAAPSIWMLVPSIFTCLTPSHTLNLYSNVSFPLNISSPPSQNSKQTFFIPIPCLIFFSWHLASNIQCHSLLNLSSHERK